MGSQLLWTFIIIKQKFYNNVADSILLPPLIEFIGDLLRQDSLGAGVSDITNHSQVNGGSSKVIVVSVAAIAAIGFSTFIYSALTTR
jgi:hypothetical protein